MAAPTPPALRPPSLKQTVQFVVGIGLAAALLIWGLPWAADTTWSEIADHLDRLGLWTAIGLLALNLAALYAYTFTLSASLPGLRHSQALTVNLAGSAVSNTLPGGGALGLATTFLMCRTWGFTVSAVSTSAIVTGVWNVLSRLLLPVIGVVVLAIDPAGLPPGVQTPALLGGLIALAVAATFAALVSSHSAAAAIGTGIGRTLGLFSARFRGDGRHRVRDATTGLRAEVADIVRTGWGRMSGGMAGFFGGQFVLFIACAYAVGLTDLSLAQLFAAFAVGRLLTAAPITPGGLGLAESGAAFVLVTYGADTAAAAATAVVFALFTHVAEIPLGATAWSIWGLRKSWRRTG